MAIGEIDVLTSEAESFLNDLFGRKTPETLKIQIWAKNTKGSFYVDDVAAAARHATSVRRDAYVAVSLVTKDLGKNRRGGAKDAAAIPGFWADIDVNGGPMNKLGAAPDFDAAFELACCVLKPTIVISSGYGLQAWWLFDEPWTFQTAEEQARAAQLSAGWIARLRREAKARGFTIDATQDLARLMRVPGTFNGKGGLEAPVTGYGEPVGDQDGPRYSLEAIAEHAEHVAVPEMNGGGDVVISVDAESDPPYKKLEALRENNEKFEQTWTRKRSDMKDESPSAYCMSIANFCARAGFTDQEIVNTLVAHRKKFGDDQKHEGFYKTTIRKARSGIKVEAEDERREEIVEELAVIGDSTDPVDIEPDRIAALFSDLIGGGFNVKELVQSNRDPATAIFRLILADGEDVPLGAFGTLYDPARFAQAFGVVTGHVPPMPKRADWIKALNGLLKMRVVRDAELTTIRSQVIAAMRTYVDATITADHHEAAARSDPFERDGHLWLAPKSFFDYCNRQLRKRWTLSEIEEVMNMLGFENRVKNFKNPNTSSGQSTTREYYRASIAVLDESPE